MVLLWPMEYNIVQLLEARAMALDASALAFLNFIMLQQKPNIEDLVETEALEHRASWAWLGCESGPESRRTAWLTHRIMRNNPSLLF